MKKKTKPTITSKRPLFRPQTIYSFMAFQLLVGLIYGYWVWRAANTALTTATRAQTELWLATHPTEPRH